METAPRRHAIRVGGLAGAHHEMKNHGRPDRRIDRMERILAWFDRWVRELPG
jgi:hypothetical protein